MAKLLKLRRGTTTQHASFTGAEGELTVDITKDTAVVHDGSQAGGRPLAREDMSNVSSASIAGRLGTDSIATSKIAAGALPTDVTVASANIVDDTIVNADINASAAIGGEKINPNFGSQNIQTTGQLTIAGALPTIVLNDENNENDFNIQNINGTFAVGDIDAGAARLEIASNGTTTIRKNLDCLEGVDVTGNISVSGTVDGVDVATLLNSKNSLSTSNGSLLPSVTTTTHAQSENSTKLATTAYVRTAVADVVNSAPAALDTLNELAAALGDDANYATTTATSIGTKLPKAGGQMTGNITMAGSQTVDGRDLSVDGSKLDGIESGATADQTKSDIDGLNINADTVDGLHGSQFLRKDTSDTISGNLTTTGSITVMSGQTSSDIYMTDTNDTTRRIHCNSSRVGFLQSNNSWGAYCDNSGNWTAEGNITAYSDARLKTDISTINDALGIVGKLRGVSYKWLKDGSDGIGVIAQEVETVLPEVVVTNSGVNPVTQEIEEIKSVDYGKIVGVLINAINELKAEVDELKGGK